LLLIVCLVAVGCSSDDRVTVEFRLAGTEPAEGLTEVVLSFTGERFYLHDEVLLSDEDISRASATLHNNQHAVDVVLTSAGREKWATATKENVGKRVAMIVNGRLISAPRINAPILKGRAVLMGDFSKEEALRIAEGLTQQ
jgi:preprotein translocase subunit SecD